MAQRPRHPGEFCWFNLLTCKPDEERTFFHRLLNWDYFSMGDMGHGVQVNGDQIGGFFDCDHPNTPPGTPPLIGVMVKVDNVDTTLERATSLGGRSNGAMTIGKNGRMGMLADPAGAYFDVWQPMGQPALTPTPGAHGTPAWWECMSTDPSKAATFYSALFGWEQQKFPSPNGEYISFAQNNEGVGGLMGIPSHMTGAKSEWRVYFNVPDVDAAAKRTQELGGKVCAPPADIPGIGRFTGIQSPQGVPLYLAKFIPPATK